MMLHYAETTSSEVRRGPENYQSHRPSVAQNYQNYVRNSAGAEKAGITKCNFARPYVFGLSRSGRIFGGERQTDGEAKYLF